MPFESENQRRFMWKFHPKIAHAWAHGKSSVTGKKEPTKDTAGHRGTKGGYRNLPRHKRKSSR